jgi:ribonucleoside-diphosphate reductase beta chain
MSQSKRSLFSTRDYYKPFDYPEFFQAWSKQQTMFWLPFEVCLQSDKHDFYNVLTQQEKSILLNIFRIFTHTDFCVSQGYMNLLNHYKIYEVQSMIIAFINMETIHAESYSQMIERLNIDVKIHEEYKGIDVLIKKHEFMQWNPIKTKLDLLRTIARISVFIEGFMLFSLFGTLLSFTRKSLLKGIGQITTFAMRDETLHHESMVMLYLTTRKELLDSGMVTQDDINKLNIKLEQDLDTAIKNEIDTINFLFNNDEYKIRCITREELIQYVLELAKIRTKKIGLKMPKNIHFDSSKYPKWIDEIINLRENVDFFTQRPTEYKKANISHINDDDFK